MSGGVVTLGETMGVLRASEVGPLHHAGTLRLGVAGSEFNVAVGARRLGADATWFGRVGNDEVGDLVLRELRAEDVTARAVRVEAPTGLMLKSSRSHDITSVTYYRTGSAGSQLCADDLDEDVIRSAGVLHVTGITPALGPDPAHAVHAAVETARAAGVPVSVDLNFRSRLWDAARATVVFRELVAGADILFAGDEEAALLVAEDDPAVAVRKLAALGPRQAVLTRGERGCVAAVDGTVVERAAVPVRAVDPVGAGDGFVAGYLAELLLGEPVERRLATATATGAFAVTVPGDWEGLPSRDELAMLGSSGLVVR